MAYRYGATLGVRGRNPQDAAATHNITGTGNTSPPAPEGKQSVRPAAGEASEDLTGAARIRTAAIELFGEHGFKAVTLKEIAEKAGVSPPLVIHHFGSKAGLRTSCDTYVADEVRRQKKEAMQQGTLGQADLFRLARASRHLTRYLLRAFLAGGPEMDRLFDQLLDDAVRYTDEAVAMGLVYPSRNQRNRVALILMQQFGSLMMAHQMQRHFGFDPLTDHPAESAEYFETVMELYTQPTINGEMYAELLAATRETARKNKRTAARDSSTGQV